MLVILSDESGQIFIETDLVHALNGDISLNENGEWMPYGRLEDYTEAVIISDGKRFPLK